MAYAMNINVVLGSSKAGLSLAAQIVNSNGIHVGTEVLIGFAEIGNGNYIWNYNDFDDDFRGGVKFYEDGTPGTILAFTRINPEESENPDIKTSEVKSAVDTRTIMSVDDLKNILLT